MPQVIDSAFHWNNPSHQGMQSICRVRAFTTGLGPVVIVTDTNENQGPPVARVIECLVCALTTVLASFGFPGADCQNAMWYLEIGRAHV